MKRYLITLVGIILVVSIAYFLFQTEQNKNQAASDLRGKLLNNTVNHPLSINEMRKQKYPGSEIKIEETLAPGENYNRYIASYTSEGLKIFGLLSIPTVEKPKDGYPVIIFNHGYIPPEEYRTTERYVAYFDSFAREGYIVFKPDYRGHGDSEGEPLGAYFSPAYTADVLNAFYSVRKLPEVNPDKMGMWGHSLGGHITLRSMVISKDIKAGVIWGGVVGSYKDLYEEWWSKRMRPTWTPSERERQAQRPSRQSFIEKFGNPTADNTFWNAVSPNSYLNDISGPIQLHHGLADETVPPVLSQILSGALKKINKTVENYTYEGADHNLSGDAFSVAMQRSVEFFNTYLK